MKRYQCISLGIVLLALSAFAHPFYVSICEINHNVGQASLELTIKIFTEDLEQALVPPGSDPLYLGEDKEVEYSNHLVGLYLEKHVKVEVDGQEIPLKYLGKETDLDAIWCYMEGEAVPQFNTIKVRNTLLMNLYDSQVNLVHVKQNQKKKSMLLNRKKPQDQVSWD